MKVKESLNVTFDESPPPTKLSPLVDDVGMVDNTLFTKKSKSHLNIVQIYVDGIIFGSTSQNLCDDFAKIMHDEFEMSMMGELNFLLGLQIKQMEDKIFFNQYKYIKEMLNNFGLEVPKPTKMPMSIEIKLTKDDKADFVDSSKYQENPKTTHLEAVKRIFRYIKGTSHLELWYPKGTRIEIVVYADSDHVGDYVDCKSTSSICTFMGYCLTSWFAKKQTALAISTIEAECVSLGKECQQALWMKQALIDYGIRLDDVSIMCDNKGAIDLSTKMPSEYQQDYKKTCAYALKIYNDPNMSDILRDIYRTLESRYVHKGRTIDPSFYNDLSDDSVAKFTAIGICIYYDAWGLDELEKNLEQIEPYNSCLSVLDIRNLIHRRTIHEKIDKEGNTIHKLPNQIETNEIFDHLRPCKLVIMENVYSAIGNRDHTQAVIALMLYCLENRQPFNLSYFIIRRMYFFKDRRDKVLPYGMILTRLFKNLKANMEQGSFDERYKLVLRKMSSLKAKQPRSFHPKEPGM
nr:copia protein [Tanacetum cinerariifolium]